MGRLLEELRCFFRELKRRNVYKVAVAYLAVAFVGIQAARMLVPPTTLPAWSDELLIYLAVFAFPIALVIAWAFEMTPEGVRRTADAERGAEGEAAATDRMRTVPRWLAVAAFALILAVATGWWVLRAGETARAQPSSERSVAVLPFAEIGRDGDDRGLGQGLARAVISELALVKELAPVSWTAVEPFRDGGLPLLTIADSLGVEHLVHGTVQRSGDSVRITAELLRADAKGQIWSGRFDREFTGIFEIQSEVARRVAEALEAELTDRTRRRLETHPTTSTAAYELYVRARELTTEARGDLRAAIELYRQAIAQDSAFAMAHAGLSTAYEEWGDLVESGAGRWTDSATTAARRAVELDPQGPQGYLALARVLMEDRGRLGEAEQLLREAISIAPSDGTAMLDLAILNLWRGRTAESLRWAWRGLPLLPNEPQPRYVISQAMHVYREEEATRAWTARSRTLGADSPPDMFHALGRGHLDTLQRHLDSRRRLAPGRPTTLMWAGLVAQLAGDTGRAMRHYRRAFRDAPGSGLWSVAVRTRLAQTLLTAGEGAEAEELLEPAVSRWRQAVESGNESMAPRMELAAAYAVSGLYEEALRWLDSLTVTGLTNSRQILHDPVFRDVRDDPRFASFRRRSRQAAMRQREDARVWAREEGLDWPPLPEDRSTAGN